jgi:hypothetical protein
MLPARCRCGVSVVQDACAHGEKPKGQDEWHWWALPGPLGRGRAEDEVHLRRIGGRRRSRVGKGSRVCFVISKSLGTSR